MNASLSLYTVKRHFSIMKKKGQVSVFVIIGILLVLLTGTYLAYKYFGIEESLRERRQLLSRVPAQFQPVASTLNQCVAKVTADALTLVGSQGGYATLPQDPLPTTFITPIKRNLDIIPNSDFQTPLWFRETGNGLQETAIPTKKQVEQNLALVINEKFSSCVENLTSFTSQGFHLLNIADKPTSAVRILPERVEAQVEFPVTLSLNEIQYTLEAHTAEVETTFGQLYDAAVEIFETENTGFFLENKTLDLLIADDAIPFSGSDLSCTEHVWSKRGVIERVKNALFENVAAMTIKGSNTDKDPDYLTFDAMKRDRKAITINLMYNPAWPTFIEISPSKGDTLTSDPITKHTGNLVTSILSSYFCLNNYHFVYTIKYPVLITLTDEQGFNFQYATEVILERNLPRKNTILPLTLPDTTSPLCDYSTAPLTITTLAVNNEGFLAPLNNVQLSFKCFPTTCTLEETGKNKNTVTLLSPPCVNGIVEGQKEGYFNGKTVVATNTKEHQDIDLVLEPLYEKNVEVFVIEKGTGKTREPYSSELATFEFRHKDARFTTSYSTQEEGASCDKDEDCGPGLDCKRDSCILPNCEKDTDCSLHQKCVSQQCAPKDNIKLLVGDYFVTSSLSRSSSIPLTTQKREVEKCVETGRQGLLGLFLTEEKCFKTEIPPVELKNVIVGGATFEFTFDRETLNSEEPLKLYILTDELPADLEGFAEIQTSLSTNKDHPMFRYPA